MTQEHPITPPPELMQQWAAEYWGNAGELLASSERYIATQAARWGADQELEACCEWLRHGLPYESHADYLRDARRPKLLSKKERALDSLLKCRSCIDDDLYIDIKEAIESLPDEQ